MADFQLTPSKLIIGGIVTVVTGILLAVGEDTYYAVKAWFLSPSFDLRFLLSAIGLIVAIVGIVVTLYGIRVMKRQPRQPQTTNTQRQTEAPTPVEQLRPRSTRITEKPDNRTPSPQRAEIVEREYDTATLKFRIWSTTDWIEIGLKSSRHVTINSHNLSKGTVTPIEESDASYFRLDNPEQEVFIVATFEVYSGPLFVFSRKGDAGTLRLNILNKKDELLFTMPEYGRTAQKYNYKDSGFEFSDWD